MKIHSSSFLNLDLRLRLARRAAALLRTGSRRTKEWALASAVRYADRQGLGYIVRCISTDNVATTKALECNYNRRVKTVIELAIRLFREQTRNLQTTSQFIQEARAS
jgi:hypothetical protein